jgi:acyl transferase domain-containing protein
LSFEDFRLTPASSVKPDALAIIGIGCLFPRADGLSAFWANIANRVDAITEIPPSHWRTADYLDADPKSPDRVYTARGGFLEPTPFDCSRFGIAPNNLEATDTAQLLGLVAARQALIDAGYGDDGKPFDRKRVSVLLGVTGTLELVIPLGARLGHPLWRRALKEAGVADDVAEDVVQRIADGYVPWQENSFPGLLGNVVAGRIANRLDLGGTNCVVDAACASSLSAVHLAALELQSGRADMVLTGGIDTFNDIFMYMCFSKTPALSPTGDARPFDADGDGTILGEGLGVLVLKRLADARRDGDRIYAVVRGIGSSSDGKGNAVYAPRAEGQMAALRTAYESAGVTPDTIELVEGHGTGTKVGDATEVSALKAVYGESGRSGAWCALGSVKSQVGHTKAAAGAAGLIKAACALYHKVLPPTLKVRRPLDVLRDGPFYVNTEKRPWLPSANHPRRAAISAFGFGGSNFHCVLEEANPVKETIDWDPVRRSDERRTSIERVAGGPRLAGAAGPGGENTAGVVAVSALSLAAGGAPRQNGRGATARVGAHPLATGERGASAPRGGGVAQSGWRFPWHRAAGRQVSGAVPGPGRPVSGHAARSDVPFSRRAGRARRRRSSLCRPGRAGDTSERPHLPSADLRRR